MNLNLYPNYFSKQFSIGIVYSIPMLLIDMYNLLSMFEVELHWQLVYN